MFVQNKNKCPEKVFRKPDLCNKLVYMTYVKIYTGLACNSDCPHE